MLQNTQPIEARDISSPAILDVHSIFYTIQGEGPFAGQPAVFIRLAGCNLQCPGCDTDYTSTRKPMTIGEIVEAYAELTHNVAARPIVVITGGEPFRQNIAVLVQMLRIREMTVQIETNGVLPIPESFPRANVTIVCSPKTSKVNPKNFGRIAAYKYVMHADSVDPVDGLPVKALDHSNSGKVQRPHDGFRGNVYLQPMDCKDEAQNHRNLQAVVKSCMAYGYTLQLQIHKIIGVE
jgi:7-carboxy-7-deazaguanine synthase